MLEVHGCLGGVWTAGALSWIIDHEGKGGVLAEILHALEARGGRARLPDGTPGSAYDVEIMKAVVERLALDAGVDIALHTRVCAALLDGQALRAVVTESKSGRQAIAGRVFIDATGDGDLAALAGCRFEQGHPDSGLSQPLSLMALLVGLRPESIADYYLPDERVGDWAAPKDRLAALLAAHGAPPSYSKPTLFHIRDDLFALMANHQYGADACDHRAITRATLEARQEIHRVLDALRAVGGPWATIKLVATGAQIGVREGRRVRGLYQVGIQDLVTGARHADAVCRATFCIDVHSTNPREGKGLESPPVRTLPYDIPARALVAADCQGLLLAGRCISGDFWAHASYRVTGNATQLGDAAGAIAAACCRDDATPAAWVQKRGAVAALLGEP